MIQQLHLRRIPMLNYYLFTFWIVLNIIDAVSTYIGIQGGRTEANPIMNLAIGQLQLIPALVVKVSLAILVGIFILRCNRRLLFAVSILMFCVTALTTTSVFFY